MRMAWLFNFGSSSFHLAFSLVFLSFVYFSYFWMSSLFSFAFAFVKVKIA